MAKLLMISGDRSLARGERGAFFNTLEEFHKYWDRIDIIVPKARGPASLHPHSAQLSFARYGGPPVESPLAFFDNVFIHQSPWPLIFQPFWILKKGREIYREQKFDLMTAHEYPSFYNGIGARFLWNKIKVPYILEIHHITGYPKAADFKERIYKRLSHIFLKFDSLRAKAVRVVNQNQVPEFLIKAGVPKEKIIYIPSLYIDLDVFKPMGLDKKYDLIFVGRLVKNKGVNLLLKAAGELKVKNPNFKLLIVGSGPLENNLKFKIENLKLKDNVFLHGWANGQEEVAKLLNESRILIMLSYNEGGPRVVLEALACGVPILATPVGIVADILKNGQFGELISWNPEDIAKKVNSLLVNEAVYTQQREVAFKIAERFEKKSAIKNYTNKLKLLI